MGGTSYTKGGIFLMAAQFINLISAFLTQVFLGIILGPASYGMYGLVISVVSISTVILTGGIPFSVSKFISAHPELAYTIKRKAIILQFILSAIIVIFYIIFAPFLAGIFNDSSLIIPIQIASLVLIPRGISAVYSMYFNGKSLFGRHATSWSIYGIGKLVLSMVLGFFFSVIGAIWGFVIAPILSLTYGFFVSRTKNKIIKKFSFKKIIGFSSFAILFYLGVSLFETLDLFLVKYLIGNNVLLGYYNAASTLSKLPYTILSTVAFILFPATAKFIKNRNTEKMKRLINESMRIILIMLLPVILLISSKATDIVSLFYTVEYAGAGPAFTILVLGLGVFTIFYVYSNMLLATNKPHIPLLVVFASVILDFILLRIFISKYSLVGAALGTLLASTFATLLIMAYVYKKFKTLIKIKSLFKVSFAAVIVYFMSFLIPQGKIFTVLGLGLLMLVYYGILWLIKEITIEDINRFKVVFIRNKVVNPMKNDL